MHKIIATLVFTTGLSLSGCATTILSETLPNQTTTTQSISLKTDQIIAVGQAIQNQQEQGLIFVGRDFNYLMTEGSAEFLNIIQTIPATQRTLDIASPLVLTMDDATHFQSEIQFRYNTPIAQLDEKQKALLTQMGFKQHVVVMENQQRVLYPSTVIRFKGKLYQAIDTQKIQQKLPTPYSITLQQNTEVTKKHPFKRATRTVLYPLAVVFDVVTISPLLIWSDLRGDFNK